MPSLGCSCTVTTSGTTSLSGTSASWLLAPPTQVFPSLHHVTHQRIEQLGVKAREGV